MVTRFFSHIVTNSSVCTSVIMILHEDTPLQVIYLYHIKDPNHLIAWLVNLKGNHETIPISLGLKSTNY